MARIVCLIPSAQVFLIYWRSWTEIDLFTGILGIIGDDVDLIYSNKYRTYPNEPLERGKFFLGVFFPGHHRCNVLHISQFPACFHLFGDCCSDICHGRNLGELPILGDRHQSMCKGIYTPMMLGFPFGDDPVNRTQYTISCNLTMACIGCYIVLSLHICSMCFTYIFNQVRMLF